MKSFAYFALIFIISFSICLVVFLITLNTYYYKSDSSVQIPHYVCLEDYELELDHDPPRCRHYLVRIIEAERKAEAELDLKRQNVTAELKKRRLERLKNNTSNYINKFVGLVMILYKRHTSAPTEPHYACLEDYELLLDRDPPVCRHKQYKLFEADLKELKDQQKVWKDMAENLKRL